MAEKDPNDFAPYAGYLHGSVWPTINARTGEAGHVVIERDSMPPQYAAAALAKLVRWARIAPEGDIVAYPDEDSREVAARESELGKRLAARAVNLEPDIFFAMYGEFGVGKEADHREVVAEIAVTLGDAGLDWSLRDRIKVGMDLTEVLVKQWKLTERP